MLNRSIPLFKVFGIPIRLDPTWFIIFALVAWTLAVAYFPVMFKGLDRYVYWIMGAAASFMLFVSVIVHELGHSYAAQKLDIPVKSITLFLFGGVSETVNEPKSASAEWIMTVAGWGLSLVLALVCFGASRLITGTSQGALASFAVVRYLAWINLLLFIFNGLPGLPLDGGRLLRASIWYFTGNIQKATYIASTTGSFFGILLIAGGVLMLFAGNLVGGMWFILIGFFLRSGAKSSYQQLVMRRALEGVRVAEVMAQNVVSVPADISVEQAVNDYFLRYHYHSFPVMEDGDRLVGIISLHDIREVDRSAWGSTRVRDIANREVLDLALHREDDLMDAVTRMARFDVGRLPVVDDGHMIGIISRRDIMHRLSTKTDLGV
ncbi:MAG TPA: site-2 protease family protein [Planctomycetota bacterium]|nr:site-2 protease family protein [Planctomycetota bacterium]